MVESFKKNKKGILIMLLSSVCACLGQMFWKLSSNSIWFLFIGFAFYGIGALLMLLAYRYGSLSVLQPVLSMNYVLALIVGFIVFNEVVTILRILGVIIIISGVVLISGGE